MRKHYEVLLDEEESTAGVSEAKCTIHFVWNNLLERLDDFSLLADYILECIDYGHRIVIVKNNHLTQVNLPGLPPDTPIIISQFNIDKKQSIQQYIQTLSLEPRQFASKVKYQDILFAPLFHADEASIAYLSSYQNNLKVFQVNHASLNDILIRRRHKDTYQSDYNRACDIITSREMNLFPGDESATELRNLYLLAAIFAAIGILGTYIDYRFAGDFADDVLKDATWLRKNLAGKHWFKEISRWTCYLFRILVSMQSQDLIFDRFKRAYYQKDSNLEDKSSKMWMFMVIFFAATTMIPGFSFINEKFSQIWAQIILLPVSGADDFALAVRGLLLFTPQSKDDAAAAKYYKKLLLSDISNQLAVPLTPNAINVIAKGGTHIRSRPLMQKIIVQSTSLLAVYVYLRSQYLASYETAVEWDDAMNNLSPGLTLLLTLPEIVLTAMPICTVFAKFGLYHIAIADTLNVLYDWCFNEPAIKTRHGKRFSIDYLPKWGENAILAITGVMGMIFSPMAGAGKIYSTIPDIGKVWSYIFSVSGIGPIQAKDTFEAVMLGINQRYVRYHVKHGHFEKLYGATYNEFMQRLVEYIRLMKADVFVQTYLDDHTNSTLHAMFGESIDPRFHVCSGRGYFEKNARFDALDNAIAVVKQHGNDQRHQRYNQWCFFKANRNAHKQLDSLNTSVSATFADEPFYYDDTPLYQSGFEAVDADAGEKVHFF